LPGRNAALGILERIADGLTSTALAPLDRDFSSLQLHQRVRRSSLSKLTLDSPRTPSSSLGRRSASLLSRPREVAAADASPEAL